LPQLRNVDGGDMASDRSIEFFEHQFEQQIRERDFRLNPFELAALPHLRGRVLDFGCGMGNLSVQAARRGCSVVALDASAVAIEHLRQVAASEGLAIDARQVDLRNHEIGQDFDTIVSIGLLMFFDCPTAFRSLAGIQSHVKEGGTAIINVLVQGTTYIDMFDPDSHCLFARGEMASRFAQWDVVALEFSDYPAPGGHTKSFLTVIARKPCGMVATAV
jgi:tellurite methyltransferase